jgi:hypothetical protein
MLFPSEISNSNWNEMLDKCSVCFVFRISNAHNDTQWNDDVFNFCSLELVHPNDKIMSRVARKCELENIFWKFYESLFGVADKDGWVWDIENLQLCWTPCVPTKIPWTAKTTSSSVRFVFCFFPHCSSASRYSWVWGYRPKIYVILGGTCAGVIHRNLGFFDSGNI